MSTPWYIFRFKILNFVSSSLLFSFFFLQSSPFRKDLKYEWNGYDNFRPRQRKARNEVSPFIFPLLFFFLSSSSPPENYYAVPYCFPVSFISLRYIVIKIQWRSTFEIKSKEERGKKEGKKKEGKTPISMRIVMNYNFPHTERWLFRDRF